MTRTVDERGACTHACTRALAHSSSIFFFMMQHFSASFHTTGPGLRFGIPELFFFVVFFFSPYLAFVCRLGVLRAALQFTSHKHTLLHKHKGPGSTGSTWEDVASPRTWSRAGDAAEGVNGANRWDQSQKLQRFSRVKILLCYEPDHSMSLVFFERGNKVMESTLNKSYCWCDLINIHNQKRDQISSKQLHFSFFSQCQSWIDYNN